MDPWAQRLLKTLRVDIFAAWKKKRHWTEGILLTGLGGAILVFAAVMWAAESTEPRPAESKAPLVTLIAVVLLGFGGAAFWRARAVGRQAKNDVAGAPVSLPFQSGVPVRLERRGGGLKRLAGFVLLGVGLLLFMFTSMPGMAADVPSEDRPWRMVGRLTGGAAFLVPGVLVLWWAYRNRRNASVLPPPRGLIADESEDGERTSQPNDHIVLPSDDRAARPPDDYQP